jgi:proline iminopeptidase
MSSAGAVDQGTIQSGPFTLPYKVEGVGHPTIVIGSALYYPRVFSEHLREHLRLVFMDHRGFAPSPGPVDISEFDLDVLVDDVERVRRELDLGSVAVIGHSGHAFMALEYARKYPEHTSHVVWIGISPVLGERMLKEAEENWEAIASPDRRAAEKENMARVSDEQLAGLAPDQAFIQTYIRNAARVWHNPRFDCSPFWEGVTVNMDMFGHVWGGLFTKIDVTDGLDRLDRPVFMALGRHDFIVAPPSSWDPILPLFSDITVRVFEKSGHTPQFEEAERFDKELLEWMQQKSKMAA